MAAAFVLAVATTTTVLAVASTVIIHAVFAMATVAGVLATRADVLLVDVAKLHARIVTAGLSSRTYSVLPANGLATWPNTATCSPPQYASNDT